MVSYLITLLSLCQGVGISYMSIILIKTKLLSKSLNGQIGSSPSFIWSMFVKPIFLQDQVCQIMSLSEAVYKHYIGGVLAPSSQTVGSLLRTS